MSKYFISKNNGKTNHAGSKARNDVEAILNSLGYIEVCAVLPIKNKLIRKFCEYIRYFNLYKYDNGSIIINQYPNLPFLFNWNLFREKKKRGLQVVTIIHDLAMRAKGTRINNTYLQKYIVNNSDCLIVHNAKMKNYLMSEYSFPSEKIIELEIFDYLLDEQVEAKTRDKNGNIIIAGNLDKAKCPYIYRLNETTKKMKYSLYGPNYAEGDEQRNVQYIGSFAPEALPAVLNGSWGLIWDGPEIDTCADLMGKYLMINNPHKTSLYIASGLPIIIWDKAAMADFVVAKGVGITVKTLRDIETNVAKLTTDEYLSFVSNIKLESSKLTTGYYLKKAIAEAEFRLS